MRDQKKAGVALSYVATVLSIVLSIAFVPFLISSLGDAEYGLYRIVQSFASQLSIMIFGIGSLTAVTVAKYNAKPGLEKEKENFLAMAIGIAAMLSLLILAIGGVMFFSIESIFKESMTVEQIKLAKKLYILLVASIGISVFRDVFSGIIRGYEHFIFSKSSVVAGLILQVLLMVVLLKLGFKSLAIVTIYLTINIARTLAEVFYCLGILKVKVKFHHFDKALFLSSFSFSLAVFLQAVVTQVNQNLDSVILGAMTTPEVVTLYSVALTIFTTFNGLSDTIASVFAPKGAKLIAYEASAQELTDHVLKPGRFQLMVVSALLFGFLIAGKDFLYLWVGSSKVEAYGIALLLMASTALSLISATSNGILDALLKRLGRSLIISGTALLNLIISIILVKKIGYMGAAIGTAAAVLIGQVVLTNIYYNRVFGFKIAYFYKEVFRGILPSSFIAVAVALPSYFLFPNLSLKSFLIKGFSFAVPYLLLLYFWGMNEFEKNTIKSMLTKLGVLKRKLKK